LELPLVAHVKRHRRRPWRIAVVSNARTSMTQPTGQSLSAWRGRLHRALRAAIRSDEMIIDRLILRLNLARLEDYGLYLHVHYSTLRDLRPGWRDEDREDFTAMALCLQNDLQALGFTVTDLPAATHAAMTVSTRLGVAYVIRGSRLTSVVVRHHVPERFPTSYLDFSPSLSWARFLQELERTSAENMEQDVIRGAKLALARFSALMTAAIN
jgi:heme oxygenase